MRRRTALATAGALTIVLLAAAAAVAANLGLLRATTDTGQVGRLNPADLAPARVVEQPAPGGATAPADEGPVGTEGQSGTTGTSGAARAGDDSLNDGRLGHEGGRTTREHFEGRGDDD